MMFELFGWAMAVLVIIPLVVLVLFISRFFKTLSMDTEDLMNFIPFLFLLYYIIKFINLALSAEAWGFIDGEFKATAVEGTVTDSAELLLLEGVPVMIVVFCVMTMIKILYHFSKERGYV